MFDWFLADTIFVKNSMVYFISILSFTLVFLVVFIKTVRESKGIKEVLLRRKG